MQLLVGASFFHLNLVSLFLSILLYLQAPFLIYNSFLKSSSALSVSFHIPYSFIKFTFSHFLLSSLQLSVWTLLRAFISRFLFLLLLPFRSQVSHPDGSLQIQNKTNRSVTSSRDFSSFRPFWSFLTLVSNISLNFFIGPFRQKPVMRPILDEFQFLEELTGKYN